MFLRRLLRIRLRAGGIAEGVSEISFLSLELFILLNGNKDFMMPMASSCEERERGSRGSPMCALGAPAEESQGGLHGADSWAPPQETESEPWGAEYSTPKDVHVPIPRSCDYVTLHGRRDFSGVTRFRILRWEINLDYSEGPHVITSVLRRERRRQGRQGRCDDRSRDPSDAAMSKGKPAALRSRKRQETDSPQEPPEGTQLC